MHRGSYYFLSYIIVMMAAMFSLSRAETYGTSSLLFLNEDPSPRCFSMAGVCSNSTNDADAAYNNPGLLGHMTESAISFSLWGAADGVGKYSFANAVISAEQYGSFAVSYLGYDSSEEEFYDLSGNKYNLTLQKDYAISGGWGIPFDERFFWGFNVKSVSSSLAEKYKARTMTFKSGAVYKSLDDFFSASIVLDNFGGTINYRYEDEKLPSSIKAEAGFRWQRRKQNIYFGISGKKILKENFIEKGSGLELELKNMPFSLSGGFKQSYNGSFITAGFGLKVSGFSMFYATQFPDSFGSPVYRVGISFNFSEQRDRDRAKVFRERKLRLKPEKLEMIDLRNNEKSFINDRGKQKIRIIDSVKKEEKKKNTQQIKKNVKSSSSTSKELNKKKKEKKEVYWQDWMLLP